MKKILSGAGLATAVSVLALAPAAGASTGPANTIDGCAAGGPEPATCTWTADVSGSYAVAGNGTWAITEPGPNNTVITVASGTGPAVGQPGSLPAGPTYTLTVTGNEGGVIGSVTGQNGLV